MQVTILGVTIEIKVSRAPLAHPFKLSKRKRREIGREIDAQIGQSPNLKLHRIKLVSRLGRDSGWNYDNGFGLREAKFWVEETWADNGNGELL